MFHWFSLYFLVNETSLDAWYNCLLCSCVWCWLRGKEAQNRSLVYQFATNPERKSQALKERMYSRLILQLSVTDNDGWVQTWLELYFYNSDLKTGTILWFIKDDSKILPFCCCKTFQRSLTRLGWWVTNFLLLSSDTSSCFYIKNIRFLNTQARTGIPEPLRPEPPEFPRKHLSLPHNIWITTQTL